MEVGRDMTGRWEKRRQEPHLCVERRPKREQMEELKGYNGNREIAIYYINSSECAVLRMLK